MRVYGILGSHRTGKTTACQKLEKDYGYVFFKSDVSGTYEKHGKDPKQIDSLAERIDIQKHILKDYTSQLIDFIEPYRGKDVSIITDRTPLDLAMYTLSDAHQHSKGSERALVDYVYDCLEITDRYFKRVALLQPGISLEDDTSKNTAKINPAYMFNLNMIAKGLLHDYQGESFVIPATATEIGYRTLYIDRNLHTVKS